jgi:hypothetical protein
MFGVLQTWTRDLRYHPHIHFFIPAICHDPDRSTWRRLSATFLLPVHPLARLIRGTFRAAFQKTPQYHDVARSTWTQPWVVDCRPVGHGHAALRYLAPYIFRVALSNNRIMGMTEDHVTFRSIDGQTKQSTHCTLPAETFMQRFLEHILPKGFVKVRCYGFFRARSHDRLEEARAFLANAQAIPPNESAPDHPTPQRSASAMGTLAPERTYAPPCPICGRAMQWVQQLPQRERAPPIGA